MTRVIKECCTCLKNKENTLNKKVGKGFFDFCPECWDSMLWTQVVLRSGTDWLVKKKPNLYVKTSQFSVASV